VTKILVIDDDDIARELLVSILRDGGHETYELCSPIGATQTIFREKIEALVLDVMMPALSGDKLAKMLRSNPRLKDLVIVLVSGTTDAASLQRLAQSVRADAVLSKRDVRDRLLGLLADILTRSTDAPRRAP
jgi:CheY-like chemotaxis protein